MMQASPLSPVGDRAALQRMYDRSREAPVVLFKHSTRCGVSARARRELSQLIEPADPDVYELVVQATPDLSAEIARSLNIRHETPQVIVLHDGKVIVHASHHRVTAKFIRAAVHQVAV